MGIDSWSKTPADNAIQDDVDWSEGMPPGLVNNSGRAMMAAHAKRRDDIGGALTSTGSAGVYALTTNSVIASLGAGISLTFKANHASPGASTLNVDGKGAKKILVIDDDGERELDADEIDADGFYQVFYDPAADGGAGAWVTPGFAPVQIDLGPFMLREEAEGSIASAATCDIGSEAEYRLNVTGTIAITSFGTASNYHKQLRFSDAVTLTHNATSLICPGGADIITQAGDVCEVVSDTDGNARIVDYQRADGKALVSKSLSAIDEDIVPDSDGARSLGSDPSLSGKAWAQIWADEFGDGDGGSVPSAYVTNCSAKAWCNLNGTGTIAIRASFNISSVTDNGTGQCSFTLASAMESADYFCVSGGGGPSAGSDRHWNNLENGAPKTASVIQLVAFNEGSSSLVDTEEISVSTMGDLA